MNARRRLRVLERRRPSPVGVDLRGPEWARGGGGEGGDRCVWKEAERVCLGPCNGVFAERGYLCWREVCVCVCRRRGTLCVCICV